MKQIGDRLKKLRLERGLSKRALAAQLKVSIPTVMRWEDGRSFPNDYNLYKIEQFLRRNESKLDHRQPQVILLPLFEDRP